MTYAIGQAALQKKKAAVKKETISSADAAKRLALLNNAGVVTQQTGQVVVGTTAIGSASRFLGNRLGARTVGTALTRVGKVVKIAGPKGLALGIGLQAAGGLLQKVAGKGAEQLTSAPPDSKPNKTFPPRDYQYNLPPHTWSLPLRPHLVDGSSGSGNIARNNHIGESFHKLRRGVIWHWSNGDDIAAVKDGKLTSANSLQLGDTTQSAIDSAKDSLYNKKSKDPNNYKYGFQFLWNPESITSSISRNMDVTPSSADRFRSVAGAFPGQETYQFQILLDRVNDFAFLRAHAGLTSANSMNHPKAQEVNANSPQVREAKNPKIPTAALNYYNHGLGDVNIDMLTKLTKYGTMADLEYLFKALNGDGANQTEGQWATLLLKPTANIGFLSPSLLGFRFGPNAQQQLSFVGWITNLSINHTYFTEDMIPLRTTVSFSCDAFAGSTVI